MRPGLAHTLRLTIAAAALAGVLRGTAVAEKVTDYPSGGAVQSGDITYIVRGGTGGASMYGTVQLGSTTTPGLIECGSGTSCSNGVLSVSGLVPAPAYTVLAGPLGGSPAIPSARSLTGNDLPVPSLNSIGGVESIAPIAHNFLTGISTSGIPSQAQPSASDITGLAPSATTDTTNAANISSGVLAASRVPLASTTTPGAVTPGVGCSVTAGAISCSSGSSALSALTSATVSNTIDNGSNAQSWTWNALSTGNALSLSSSSGTSGTVLYAALTTSGNSGYAGYFQNSATGATGYAGYFAGSVGVTGNVAIAGTTTANNLSVTGACVGCAPVSVIYYTTTSRTLSSSDVNNLVVYNSSSAGSWKIPNAGTTGFTAPNDTIYISNMGTAALTLSTTSGGSVFNGIGATTSYQIPAASSGIASWIFCVPDGSNNYYCTSK